jgi:hypothetical protein
MQGARIVMKPAKNEKTKRVIINTGFPRLSPVMGDSRERHEDGLIDWFLRRFDF